MISVNLQLLDFSSSFQETGEGVFYKHIQRPDNKHVKNQAYCFGAILAFLKDHWFKARQYKSLKVVAE